jgi:short-subunit dehydrogenase
MRSPGDWFGRPPRDLVGTRVIVTGASSGVGRSLADLLARRGCRVLATARRVERLAHLAEGAPGPCPILFLAGDLCDPGFRTTLVADAIERLGGIDIVISAAGAGAVGSFRESTPETFARIVDLDFIGQAELVRACLPALTRGRDPAIMLVGSILGLHPLPLHGAYAASKAALRSLATTLRLELAEDGIDVLVATLGPVASEFWDSLIAGERPAWSRGTPMPVARAAAAIIDGLERRRPEIIPGWRAKTYAFLARYLPGLIDRAVARHLKRAPRASASGETRTES